MNHNEHLFLKLSEECAEVQQRVSKLLQFGEDECEPGQKLSNRVRLRLEVNDLLAVIDMLEESGRLPSHSAYELAEHIRCKKIKIDKYLRYSEELGLVQP